ncbi:hypothetical protein VYU27_007496 [Nannochloropsis oceanica]
MTNEKRGVSLPWFFLACLGSIGGIIFLALAEGSNEWLVARVKDPQLPQKLTVGLYTGYQRLGNVPPSLFDPAWCGADDNHLSASLPSTPWCSSVTAVKALTLTGLLLVGFALFPYLWFLGTPPKPLQIAFALVTLLGTIACALSAYFWMDVQHGFCPSLAPSFRTVDTAFTCRPSRDFFFLCLAGLLFLLASFSSFFTARLPAPSPSALAVSGNAKMINEEEGEGGGGKGSNDPLPVAVVEGGEENGRHV